MTIQQAEDVLKKYDVLIAHITRLEEKVESLTEKVGEFAEQIEEAVIRVEDAAREPRDDY
jgi:cell division septum initiation protein DivIVA